MSNKQTGEETVKPPEPEGQQDDDDTIRWDGSETEMVADDDAEEFEETKTAVKIGYTLTQEEISRALHQIGMPQKRSAVLTALAVLSFLAAAADFTVFGMRGMAAAVIFGAIFAALGVCILVVPWLFIRKHAKRESDRQGYILKIYPDMIEGEHAGRNFKIPLDGTVACKFYQGLVILHCQQTGNVQESGVLIFPLRSVEPSVLADVEAILRSGTAWVSAD